MSITVTPRESSSNPGGKGTDSATPESFKAAVTSNPPGALSVQGNSIDTGRYVITGSTDYDRPIDGGHANDGMVKIFDKTNNSFVDVYGDPHVYTSAGDRANFQADGLTINLADGTQIQFKPTAETNGVSHIDAIAVSKGGETVTQSGYFNTRGGVTTGTITEGGPSSAQGFNDVKDTVLSVGHDGSLGTLVNSMGMQLNSKGYEESLDGMGGGVSAFADLSGIDNAQAYGTALAANADKTGGPNAAEQKSAATSAIPGKSTDTGATDALASLLQQLITALQPQGAGQTGTTAPTTDTTKPADPTKTADTTQPKPTTDAGPATTGAPAGDLASLLQQLITLLQGQAGAGSLSPQDQALVKQLLPLLEAKLDSLGGAASAGPAGTETGLLQQLITALQPQATGTDEKAAATTGAAYSPSTGISQAEIEAMLAHSNGTGPEVIYADYDKAAATPATQTDTAAVPAKSYNPAMGISGDEISAMLAAANGTGPEVQYADYHMAATTTQPESSSTPAGSTAV